MNTNEDRASGSIGATKTSFGIVEHLRDEGASGVSDVATALGISKSTAHNHLQTLLQLGYVVQVDGGYALGLKFLDLGDHARTRHALYHASIGEMDDLVDAVGERGQVMVEENGRGVYIYQVKSEQGLQTDSHIGTTVDLHTTAVGKSYLAFCDEEHRNEILDDDLPQLTSKTIDDRTELDADLDAIRERGHAFNDEERITGMRAVGAPILSDDETILGSISVSGPTTRMKGEWYHSEVPEMVKQAARVIGIRATYS
ncbi:helix-turn-helix domain-containing protein [Haloferax sp. MBLA0076]|uniref:Helix-turn-helix domain-containing protein n=1 Tax=Haloferax litoreum TaxID=2666140 RepID=A0A6A8GP40_9EURY|nr:MULTISPECIES: IclR family transcriptional regulator [Haloferax]KAB1190026.1 IclR family transcriptional regulator [Haloferax sp. CBA1148]MRX23800.1 helix-turn-helix domain-containing protein [Haloferax litoreum]